MLLFYCSLLLCRSYEIDIIPAKTLTSMAQIPFLEESSKEFAVQFNENVLRLLSIVDLAILRVDGEIAGTAFLKNTKYNFTRPSTEQYRFKDKGTCSGRNLIKVCRNYDKPKCISDKMKYFTGRYKNTIKTLELFSIYIFKKYREKGFSVLLINELVKRFKPKMIALAVAPKDQYMPINMYSYANMNFNRTYFTDVNPQSVTSLTVDQFMDLKGAKSLLDEYKKHNKKYRYIGMYAFIDDFTVNKQNKDQSLKEIGKELVLLLTDGE